MVFFKLSPSNQMCFLHLYGTPQFVPAIFQVLNSHIFMVSGYHSDSATPVFMT